MAQCCSDSTLYSGTVLKQQKTLSNGKVMAVTQNPSNGSGLQWYHTVAGLTCLPEEGFC